jgi:hypothetical protein
MILSDWFFKEVHPNFLEFIWKDNSNEFGNLFMGILWGIARCYFVNLCALEVLYLMIL